MSSVQGCKIIWCLLSTVAKLSGVFCPQWQKNVVSFVHPGKKVWCLLFTLAKNAWCLLGLVSFVRLPTADLSFDILQFARCHSFLTYKYFFYGWIRVAIGIIHIIAITRFIRYRKLLLLHVSISMHRPVQ